MGQQQTPNQNPNRGQPDRDQEWKKQQQQEEERRRKQQQGGEDMPGHQQGGHKDRPGQR